jgi:hypothetical protein
MNNVPNLRKNFILNAASYCLRGVKQIARGEFNDEIADALTNLAGEVAKNYKEYK